MVREINRLSALQVRIARHDKIDMLLSETEQRDLKLLQLFADRADLFFRVKAKIERGLIVAASRGVQLCAGFAYSFSERTLDVHVDVFERFAPLKFSGRDFLFDLAQPNLEFFLFRGGNNSRFGERFRMRNRASDVVTIKPAIERNGLAVSLRDFRNRFFESSFAHVNRAKQFGSL